MEAHWGEAETAEERALEHARRAGDHRQEVHALGWIAAAVRYGPTPATSGLARLAQVLAESRGDPGLEVAALLHMACVHGMLDEAETGRAQLERAEAICDEYGLSLHRAFVMMARGELELLLTGDYPAAEEALRRACQLLDAIGDQNFLSTVAAYLAHALLEQGRYHEAEEYVELSRASGASDDIVTQVGWRSARACILSHRGEGDAAVSLAGEARALAEQTDDPTWRAQTLRIVGRVLVADGRTAEAVVALEQALELCESKQNRALVARLRPQLDALQDA
jgi:tetratricopeptide (TPR) repeat protein